MAQALIRKYLIGSSAAIEGPLGDLVWFRFALLAADCIVDVSLIVKWG